MDCMYSRTWKVDVVRCIPGSFSTFPLLQSNFQKLAGWQRIRMNTQCRAESSYIYFKVPSDKIGSALEWYHWIGLKRTSTDIWFLFFNFDLEYLRRVQRSEPLHTKINPTSCLLGSWFVKSPFFLLAVTLSFVEKIRWSAVPIWFGLRIVGFLQIFYLQAVIQRRIVDSSTYLEHGSAEKIAVCAHTTCDPNKEDD